jgi:hypothetical protein
MLQGPGLLGQHDNAHQKARLASARQPSSRRNSNFDFFHGMSVDNFSSACGQPKAVKNPTQNQTQTTAGEALA